MAEYRTVTAVATVTTNTFNADGTVSTNTFDVTADGQQVTVVDPYISIEQTDDGAVVTVTDTRGSTQATIYNGQQGEQGQAGSDGQDGFSPVASVSKVGDTATITITDANGTTTASVTDGVSDYDNLSNRPSINSVTLSGNKTASDLGLASHPDWNEDDATSAAHIDNRPSIREGTDENGYAVTMGYLGTNTASGDYSVAAGWGNTVSGTGSSAIGRDHNVTGRYAFAAGRNNDVSGNFGVGLGYSTHVSGTAALVIGYSGTASAQSAVVIGQSSQATESAALATGYLTQASGKYSHTEGRETVASGAISHAEGYGTTATRAVQHVSGRYNIVDTSVADPNGYGDYAEIVGNGMADNARSNARTLDWSGNEVLSGKLTVGAGPTGNMDVATKQYVDNAIPTIPTKLSDFTDDLGSSPIHTHSQYLTSHQDLSGYVKTTDLATVATSGDYDDLSNKPSIPAAVTETTVSGWGFTKNTGTYSKPSGGIPKSDLASAVQTSLGKADTALQSYTETDPVFTASAAHGISSTDITNWNNKSDFSGSYNDLTNKPTIPTVPTKLSGFTDDLGSSPVHTHSQYLTSHQDISGKQDVLTTGDGIDITSNVISNTQGIEYIVGTQAASTNAWTGVSKDKTLKTGKIIAYYLPYAGTSSAATLKLTMADGTTTGAIALRRTGSSTVTTHFAVNNVIVMIYDGTYWRVSAYYDANSNTIPTGYCTTAAATAAKSATCTYGYRDDPNYFPCVFRYANTAANATLAIGSYAETALPIYVNGARTSSSNQFGRGVILFLFYNNAYYCYNDGRLPIVVNGTVTSVQDQFALYTKTASLAAVATSGSYADLSNKPTIPTVPSTVSSFTNDAGYQTAADVSSAISTALAAYENGNINQY